MSDYLYEDERFFVTIGVIGEDKDPQYLVTNKATGVVEFCNTSLYFVRDWSRQMTEALAEQDKEIANVNKRGEIINFPGGGDGRAN